jgi:hypothetical protein
MELKSNFDFKTLRKKQGKAMQAFNRVGRGVENLGLSDADKSTIAAILTKRFEEAMKNIQEGGDGGVTAPGKKEAEPAAAGGGFV